jgi:integrase/recombinase XerD
VPIHAGGKSEKAWLEAFLEELRSRHYSRSYASHARTCVPRFFEHAYKAGLRDLRAVGEAHVVSYLAELRKRRTRQGGLFAASTAAVYLRTLKAFFAFLERHGAILRNPALEVRAPTSAPLPRQAPSVAVVRRLVESPSPWTEQGRRDRAILETLYGTGIRASECVRLNISDVDLAAGTLQVRNGKGRKDRVVPLCGRAKAALQGYLLEARSAFLHDPKEEALFLARSGRRMAQVSLHHLLRGYGEGVGIKAYPHLLRHACATHLLKGDADIRHVQQLLGHALLQTTALYAGVSIEDLRRVIARSHPREVRSSRGKIPRP